MINWGIFGIAMIRNICDFIALYMLVYYTKKKYSKGETLVKFDMGKILDKIGEYFKISLPMGVTTYLGWAFFEV